MIVPDWPAPPNVMALQTTRKGGFSGGPYDSLNLGDHVGDDPLLVERNRQSLNEILPSEPVWLNQVHGVNVIDAGQAGCRPTADACIARRGNAICTVMTADCLPILLCDTEGGVVGAVHAGWRGLANGVIEATIMAMGLPGDRFMAWLGPAIGPQAFEVGEEVRQAFVRHDPAAISAFTARGDKYLADLYALARHRLSALGVARVYGGRYCTLSDEERFFSYRRDGCTGRMASMIWIAG